MLVLHTNTCHQLLSSFYEIVQQLKVWWLVMQNYPLQWLQNIFYSYVNLRNILKIWPSTYANSQLFDDNRIMYDVVESSFHPQRTNTTAILTRHFSWDSDVTNNRMVSSVAIRQQSSSNIFSWNIFVVRIQSGHLCWCQVQVPSSFTKLVPNKQTITLLNKYFVWQTSSAKTKWCFSIESPNVMMWWHVVKWS